MNGQILVIRGGAIGDFILTLPVLAALRAQFPRTHLAVLGYPHIAQLALVGGLADEVRPIEARGLATFFNPHAEPPPELAAFFARFAIILSYLYDPDEVFQQSVQRCSRAQFIAGPHRPDDTAPIPASQVFLKPLERLAIFDADPTPRLRVSPNSVAPNGRSGLPAGQRQPGFPAGAEGPHSPTAVPTLAVHPGSGSDKKNWPEPKWAELLEGLAACTHWNLLLVGGEAEGDRLDRLAKQWPPARLEIARSVPLVELAGRLAGCDAFAGHDSGITHLAAALGLSGLVLWGDSRETIWRPGGDRMRLLRSAAGLEALEVRQVTSALLELCR